MENKIITPESLHSVDYLGNPVYQVPMKNPKKIGICSSCNRSISTTVKGNKATCPDCKVKIDVSGFELVTLTDTTIKHFKQYGLFPTLSLLSTYGNIPIELSLWYKTRLATLCHELYHPDIKIFMQRLNKDLPGYEDEYADRGTMIHGHIQKDLDGEVVTGPGPASLRAIAEIRAWEAHLQVIEVHRERCHCDPIHGYGGTIDVDIETPQKRIVGDYKTKHSAAGFEGMKAGKRQYFWNAAKQISGYASLVHADTAYVIPIRVEDDHPDTGETCFIKLTEEEMKKGLFAIRANQNAWCANLDYYPQDMYKKGECWSLDEIMKGAKE